MHHMTHRLSVSLPDDLYAHVQRVAAASRVSEAAIVRSAVAELLPRTARVLDFIGTEGAPTPADVTEVDAWMVELQRFLGTAPPKAQAILGEFLHPDEPQFPPDPR